MHRVLVLGAGMVAKPLIDYLLKNGCRIKIACNTCDNAQKILKDHPNGEIVYWEADNIGELKPMIKEAELVVSLLPYKFHARVAEVCIEHRKHMVTTSYVRQEMSDLDEAAKKAGIIILNEIGLDPGIDHMSAMRIIDNVHSMGGHIEKFWSLCGALPAPECADNPMGYKFTWSPEGVLLAGMNDARYLDNGEIIHIKPENLFRKTFTYEIKDIGPLEVYANRDSVSYIDIYGLRDIRTMYRGTLRFSGWCETIDALKSLNLLSREEEGLKGKTYAELIRSRIGRSKTPIKEKLADHLGLSEESAAVRSFEWLGLFNEIKIPASMKTSFEVISDLMMGKMILKENERDMIILKHIFLARYKDGSSEIISSQMIDYGSPSADTSISRTVALPAAMAVKLILDGRIDIKGVYRPVRKEIYMPVLSRLEKMGIRTEEKYGLPESELIF
ncbi:MAG: saccharopine dehydrogenase NADP-binding domain-containing protein [Bacteroidales bacterium]|nr:saccharopine dehydrogenase NADP-binding domain-containing protein [Bacteroidales bacterium]